jgi:hypothetical protein
MVGRVRRFARTVVPPLRLLAGHADGHLTAHEYECHSKLLRPRNRFSRDALVAKRQCLHTVKHLRTV